jgi:hypothetical protein
VQSVSVTALQDLINTDAGKVVFSRFQGNSRAIGIKPVLGDVLGSGMRQRGRNARERLDVDNGQANCVRLDDERGVGPSF